MARGGKRPGAGRKPKPRPMTQDEVQAAADRAEGVERHEDDDAPRGRGQPTSYRSEYADQAESLCRLSATDADIAAFFKVAISTLYLWKLRHPEFSEALKRGKDAVDDMVEQRLAQRALGYSHDAVKVMQYEGQPVIVPYTEHYPPDTTAAIFWLKNRRPDLWRDKTEVEVRRKISDLSDDELARIAAGGGPRDPEAPGRTPKPH